MLRKLLIATALLTASGAVLAHNDSVYGRVISIEPRVSIAFGSGGYYDGFRVLYESGGSRYWTTTPYRPSHTIVLPPRHHVHHGYQYRYPKGGWDDRRYDQRDDRDRHRGGHRDDRRYGGRY
ncbi:MAG: hypothetical protein ACSLEZ_04400 [Thiobacillus sp.]